MGCRAIRLAALSAIFALMAWASVSAQNLDAGKTPQQMFSNTCTACHTSPRGLLKSVGPGQLPGFLRQHYTTGSEMAGVLAGYLMQNGAAQRVEPPPAKAAKGKKKSEEEAPVAAGPRPKREVPDATADDEMQLPWSQKQAEGKSKQVETKDKGKSKKGQKKGKREPEESATPSQPPSIVAPEPGKPADAKPGDTKPTDTKPGDAQPASATPAPPAEVKVDSEGLPTLPEPPPLSPELAAPPAPAAPLPPPSPPM